MYKYYENSNLFKNHILAFFYKNKKNGKIATNSQNYNTLNHLKKIT